MSSTVAKRLEQAVFYLDESIYSQTLRERMEELGANVRHAGAAFPHGTIDEVWLRACGERGWIVLSRDKNLRRRPLERQAIREAGVAAFVFTAGNATASDTADCVARLLQHFVNVAISEPRPFVRTFGFGRSSRKVNLGR